MCTSLKASVIYYHTLINLYPFKIQIQFNFYHSIINITRKCYNSVYTSLKITKPVKTDIHNLVIKRKIPDVIHSQPQYNAVEMC